MDFTIRVTRGEGGTEALTCVDFFVNRFAKRLRDTVAAAFSRCRHDLWNVPLRQGVWLADAEKNVTSGQIQRLQTAATIPNGVLFLEKVSTCEGRKPLSLDDSDGKPHLLSGPLRLCAFARGPARTLPSESGWERGWGEGESAVECPLRSRLWG